MDSLLNTARALLGVGPVLLLLLLCAHAQEPARPNVVVLLADDLGIDDLAVYNPENGLRTPSIERMAREGMRFTDAHSGGSFCSPSRYSLLTGRYAWRTWLRRANLSYFSRPLIEPDRLTLPAMLRERGYATAAIGKWHLGLDVPQRGGGFARYREILPRGVDFSAPVESGPLEHGFDYYFGRPSDAVGAFVENRRFIGEPEEVGPGERFAVPGWRDDVQEVVELRKALEFIERHRRESPAVPFFLYHATHTPHAPWEPAAEIAGRPVAGTSGQGAYGDMVLQFDAMLGAILDRLDELGIADETLVVVCSDNGPALRLERGSVGVRAEGGWRGGKGMIWEGGHRVPLLVRWGDGTPESSRIPPGTVSDRLVGLQDCMATLASLVGAPLPDDAAEDSESFLATLRGAEEEVERSPMVHEVVGVYALRVAGWKLVQYPKRKAALYDLARDPGEVHDVAEDNPAVVERLGRMLAGYRVSDSTARRLSGGRGGSGGP